jgi:hypothetical protein
VRQSCVSLKIQRNSNKDAIERAMRPLPARAVAGRVARGRPDRADSSDRRERGLGNRPVVPNGRRAGGGGPQSAFARRGDPVGRDRCVSRLPDRSSLRPISFRRARSDGDTGALFIVVTLLAGLVVSIKAFWARVAVRVLRSWIAATGLLMIGWTLRAGN